MEIALDKRKTIDDLLEGTKDTTSGSDKVINYDKQGDYSTAVDDFESLQLDNVVDLGCDKMKGTLPDGTTVMLYPKSTSTSVPTIAVQYTRENIIKIRYIWGR